MWDAVGIPELQTKAQGGAVMPELTAHEKFLQGIPLTDELAAVREGRGEQAKPSPAAPRRAQGDPDRELTRGERLELKEMVEMPGWELFRRLGEKAVRFHEKCAIAKSQNDPLANRDEIAAEWAYLKLFQRAMMELQTMVSVEIAELEKQP
jgi:hypothetical protein